MRVKEEWFGGRLKELREKAGLTQRQLADLSGLQVGAIRDLEQKRIINPTWSTVLALCGVLNTTPDAFIQEPEERDPKRGRPPFHREEDKPKPRHRGRPRKGDAKK